MLEVRNVAVSYGRHRALEGVNLRVDKGEICVILGANGAGKSTLLKAIAGMVRAEPGSEVMMNGTVITAMKAHRIVEEGIALVPEGRGIFGDLTVAENLQLGAFANRARTHEATTLAEIFRLFPRLAERKGQTARTMSGGEQQMVAIGRALMSRPDILMLDEPSLGLSPLLSKELFRSLAEVAKTGVGILLVEQNARQSLKIAQRGYLIENGHVTGENTAEALMSDPAVISAYLGGAGATSRPEPATPRFVLPSFLRLPLDLSAMSRSIGELAARAARIHAAFIRVLRRDHDLPSAFVGRYDPRAMDDPWADVGKGEPSAPAATAALRVSADAQLLSGGAASLALRASERLAAHISSARLSTLRPSAFAASTIIVEQEQHNEPPPVALVEPEAPDATIAAVHGVIGHNSAGFVTDDDQMNDKPVQGKPQASSAAAPPPATKTLSIADLAARAAAIHAAHVARNRKASPSFAAVAAPPSGRSETAAPGESRLTPGLSFIDLASRAASIHAAHVAKVRAANRSVAKVEAWTVAPPAARAENSAISDLVARASAIHAAHVAEQRKRLTLYTIPVQLSPKADKNEPARKKRKKHKEA